MVNPQPTDAHIRIAHSIEEEIMMRDFTKRQRSILDLILRLSWGCGKKTAIIPLQKDFEMVGVDQTKVKSELNWLVNAKVISWDQDEKEFSFNKNYDEWKVSIVVGYDKKRFAELLNLNIRTCQNSKSALAKTASEDNEKLAEMASPLAETARNDLTKKQVLNVSNAEESTVGEVSKESNNNTTTITAITNNPEPCEQVNSSGRLPGAPEKYIQSDRLPGASDESTRALQEIEGHYFKLTGRFTNPTDCIAMTEILDRPLAVPIGYKSRVELIKKAMDRMTDQKRKQKGSSPIKSFSYYRDGILEDYKLLEVAHKRGDQDGNNADPKSDTRQYGNGIIDYNQGFSR